MGYYFSLRGWLEVDEDERDTVIETLQSLIASCDSDGSDGDHSRSYLKGWCWCNVMVNWTAYIFYGADVQREGLDLMEDTLALLVTKCPEIRGYSHAQGEDHQYNFVYKISNGQLIVEESSTLTEG